MEIGEFRKQFMEQLRFDAEHEGSAPEAQFISRALELLEDITSEPKIRVGTYCPLNLKAYLPLSSLPI
jgi:hypothetical protein